MNRINRITDHQILRLRTHHQHLDPRPGEPPASAEAVVTGVCGIQAQDLNAARLSVFTRSPGLSLEAIERARLEERSIVRTWGPRGTLHLLPAADLGWLLAVLGPPAIAADNSRMNQLELDEPARRRGVETIVEALSTAGALTRAELRAALEQAGLPYEGQAAIHQIGLAALEGHICLGLEQDSKETYVLVEDWISQQRPALRGEAALAELALRYLRAYAPAGERDLAAWSGIGLRQARQAFELIAAELVQVEVAGTPAWLFTDQLEWVQAVHSKEAPTADPLLRLLPAFDTYLLGYASRDLFLPPQYTKQVNKGGGWILPTMLLDGHVVGTWSSRKIKRRLEVSLAPFEPLPEGVNPGFEALGAEVARFLGYNSD